MRENIIIHNVKEGGAHEDVQAIAVNALRTNGYNLDGVEFDRIHRSGSLSQKKPRMIIAKPSKFKDTQRLLATRLPHDRKQGAWISPQFTEKVRETRRQLGEMASSIKKTHPNATVSLKFTTLTVNNNRLMPPFIIPKPTEVLLRSKSENAKLESVKFSKILQKSELGSTFTARSTPVLNLNEVRQAYQALLLDPETLSVTHNIAGYVLPNGSSAYADDGDFGMGRIITQAMEQIGDKARGYAVFVTRQYGGNKLGFKRFDIVKELTLNLFSSVAKPTVPATVLSKPKPHQHPVVKPQAVDSSQPNPSQPDQTDMSVG